MIPDHFVADFAEVLLARRAAQEADVVVFPFNRIPFHPAAAIPVFFGKHIAAKVGSFYDDAPDGAAEFA
jgi:hypothetical protein